MAGPGHPRAARGGLGLEVNNAGTNVAYAGGGGSGSYFNPHNTVRDPNGPENGGGGGSGGLGGAQLMSNDRTEWSTLELVAVVVVLALSSTRWTKTRWYWWWQHCYNPL